MLVNNLNGNPLPPMLNQPAVPDGQVPLAPPPTQFDTAVLTTCGTGTIIWKPPLD
jgi:hypothetical protein